MINKIKGFERGEIKKADISAGFSRLAPLLIQLSNTFYEDLRLLYDLKPHIQVDEKSLKLKQA